MDCFPFRKLVDFSEGTMEPQEHQALLDHMASGCKRCRDETDLLKEVIALMRADRSERAPADALNAALDLFDKMRKDTLADTIKKKVAAILAFDSCRQAELAGIRNLKGLGKQLLFKAEGYDIDLRFSPTDRSEFEILIGQVLHRDSAAGVPYTVVSLSAGGEEVLLTTTDAFGIFSFRNVPAQRRYDFKIAVRDMEILIEGVSSC